MLANRKIFVLKKQHMEADPTEQQLKKVTKSNRCLICALDFTDDTAVHRHFLNIHHRGCFLCTVVGCNYVANTNGDLRMHCLIWHSEQFASGTSLPENSIKEVTVQKVPVTSTPNATVTSISMPTNTQPQKKTTSTLDKATEQTVFPSFLNKLQCSTCSHPFRTEIGVNMHQRYHRFNSFLPKLKKMSDIETLDELYQILEMNNEKRDEKVDAKRRQSVHYNTNKENTPAKRKKVTSPQEPPRQEKQAQPLEREQKPQPLESQQKPQPKPQQIARHQQYQQWADQLKLNQANITQHLQKLKALSSARQYIDNNGFPTRSMPADVRGARKRPLSPAGSVVSISSSESVDNNEMDYYEDVEVDIEF